MEVKIGVQNTTRELVIDSSQSADEVAEAVSAALTGPDGILTLSDSRGRRVLVPVDKLAYVEIGAASSGAVGFRT